ncbi:anti-sigma factor antagonist [Rhodococcus ruber Chol-4]|uniref:Anti-sigma factor antagonist n=1 Tax=Rhodococcus ruber TaxID=1830 RepID=A0A098BKB9_9NOCA|nr:MULTISPECIES: STAS domain-containing protein [Rhodococcus]MDO2377381.1 STAS domain-containing protein [Rhodococcus ruber]RIK13667.1 MAG: anti-sigma factor antagonist [Acidobacteriota bacterium]ATQ27694.1 anti-sigma factor antagonist [Rhodococcus ruber]AUM15338.1 anti-sigma factor antagonist [Rhodococcus ruber]AWG99067.1 anti-sigma factor antagonist [Rhodococcus ruber]
MTHFATRTTGSDVVVVRPEGRLNMVAAPRLREQLRDLVDSGSARVVVDLAATEFIDSSGLGALVSGLKAARQAGGDLRLASPTAQVRSVLSLTSLDRVLRTYDSADAAFDGD